MLIKYRKIYFVKLTISITICVQRFSSIHRRLRNNYYVRNGTTDDQKCNRMLEL